MPSVKEYFKENRYQPTYFMGDRVHGLWNNIPFRGSIANDSLVNEDIGPEITIFLDLPIKHEDKIHTIIKTTHEHILKSGAKFNKK